MASGVSQLRTQGVPSLEGRGATKSIRRGAEARSRLMGFFGWLIVGVYLVGTALRALDNADDDTRDAGAARRRGLLPSPPFHKRIRILLTPNRRPRRRLARSPANGPACPPATKRQRALPALYAGAIGALTPTTSLRIARSRSTNYRTGLVGWCGCER